MARPIANAAIVFTLTALLLFVPGSVIGYYYFPQLNAISSTIIVAITGLIVGVNKRKLFGDNITMAFVSTLIAAFYSLFMTLTFLQCLAIYAVAFIIGYKFG